MGAYHTRHPENGRNKKRHRCRKCGRKIMEIFMRKVNDWHQGQWECHEYVARYKCLRGY